MELPLGAYIAQKDDRRLLVEAHIVPREGDYVETGKVEVIAQATEDDGTQDGMHVDVDTDDDAEIETLE